MALAIVEVDPQGADALALLDEAACEARELYQEIPAHPALRPANGPTPARGIYLLGYEGGRAVASGALRPLDGEVAEVRRIFVTRSARRGGVANQMLRALESAAREMGYTTLRLETGWRQLPAIQCYLRYGFVRIPPFGPHVGDPTSVCFEKAVTPRGGRSAPSPAQFRASK